MKILITGGMGFIGSHLIDLLLQENHKIIVLTKSYSKKKNISHIHDKIKVEKVDVGNFVVSNSKLKLLGWKPKVNLNKGIKETLEHFKSHR